MVNRILSLQLVFTLAASQAWAITGGPYDSQARLASMSGTYGVSLAGTNTDHLSSTGVMLLSVPVRGLCVAKTLVFDQGLMYAGSATGTVKLSDGGGSTTLLTQLTHYVTRTVTDGTQNTPVSYADSSMNGLLKLKIKPDFFTGITAVTGAGNFWQQSIRLTSVTSTVVTVTDDVSTSIITTTTAGEDAQDAGTVDVPFVTDPESASYLASTLTVSADGLRQSGTVSAITNFTQPTQTTNWGVGFGETGVAPTSGDGF